MNISIINGSPKMGQSNSSVFSSIVVKELEKENEIKEYHTNKRDLDEVDLNAIIKSDILLLAFPLYIDGIPVNLLNQLISLERAYRSVKVKDTMVYVLMNNGFYEGEQNKYAIEMIEHFCSRSGIRFGQGMGIGAGEMCAPMVMSGMPVGKAVLTSLGAGMDQFIQNIRRKQSASSVYSNPNFPMFAFKFMAERTHWDKKAKANGLTRKDLNKRYVNNGR